MLSTISPASLPTALGSRLRDLRLQRNATQADLAARSGISTPTLAALENGRGTLQTLASVMYALGRESEWEGLLQPDPPRTLDDVAAPRPKRQRARP